MCCSADPEFADVSQKQASSLISQWIFMKKIAKFVEVVVNNNSIRIKF